MLATASCGLLVVLCKTAATHLKEATTFELLPCGGLPPPRKTGLTSFIYTETISE